MKIATFYTTYDNDFERFDDDVNEFMSTVNVVSISVSDSVADVDCYMHTLTVLYTEK